MSIADKLKMLIEAEEYPASGFCFYDPKRYSIIDCLREGNKLTCIRKQTLEEVQKRYSHAAVWEVDKAMAHRRQAYIMAPVQIDEARYWEMLNVLPPVGHCYDAGYNSSSFKMAERITDDITSIYARVDGRYYHLQDSIKLTHQEIMRKILESLE